MAFSLYYVPAACSLAVHVVMNMIGTPPELKKVDFANRGATPGFLQASPLGQVPALQEGNFYMVENGAILIYLLDSSNSKQAKLLLPRKGHDRAAALQWLLFGNATLHPAYGTLFMLAGKIGAGGAEADAAKILYPSAVARVQSLWDNIEEHLTHKQTPFLAGNNMTAGDVFMTVASNWNNSYFKDANIKLGKRTKQMITTVVNHPQFQKALAEEGAHYEMHK